MKIKMIFMMLVPLSLMIFLSQNESFASLGERASDPRFSVRAPARFAQGVINFSFGWSAFVIEPAKSFKNEKDSKADGFFRGLAYPISYTVLGMWDIGTCWIPGPDKLDTDIAKVKHNVFNL